MWGGTHDYTNGAVQVVDMTHEVLKHCLISADVRFATDFCGFLDSILYICCRISAIDLPIAFSITALTNP